MSGEPTPYAWPEINSNFGILDIAGFPKDTFYYYQVGMWLYVTSGEGILILSISLSRLCFLVDVVVALFSFFSCSSWFSAVVLAHTTVLVDKRDRCSRFSSLEQ